jgi:hypothetical protein
VGNGEGPPNYRATALLRRTPLEPVPYEPATQQFRPSELGMGKIYREWLFHGPCFEVMRKLVGLDGQGAAVEVKASDPHAWLPSVSSKRGWVFDPGLLDSGPQMALVWARATRGESALPTSMGSVRRHGNGPLDRLRMYFHTKPGASPHQVKAEVDFVDPQGRLRMQIKDLECTSSTALNRLGGGWQGKFIVDDE